MKKDIPNIILYGETGAGKSSIINMIPGNSDIEAEVSNSARGVTTTATRYQKTINGKLFNIYDTPGLNEGVAGRVNGKYAVEILYNLLSTLSNGVNLLVMVMRGPRINSFTQKNYDLLHNVICQKNVPIVLFITGLDDESERSVWWEENRGIFHKYGMHPQGHACLSTLKRTGITYDRSKREVVKLLHDTSSLIPWKMSKETPVVTGMLSKFLALFGLKSREFNQELFEALKNMYGEQDAQAIMENISKLNVLGRIFNKNS